MEKKKRGEEQHGKGITEKFLHSRKPEKMALGEKRRKKPR